MSTLAIPAVDPRPDATPLSPKERERSTGPHPRTPTPPSPTADQVPEDAAPSAPAARRTLLQFQLGRLIDEILTQTDLEPLVRASLLQHLGAYPEDPGLALLAHLHNVQDPENLPPFQAQTCRKPTTQSSSS
ncbi:hypothetical protein ACHMXB_22305 (plasmid) [Arthrobacter sp. UC242_113]|uniref:hypothetical protein n=1 Tax=Arthrobacter sp. UC242_113 TaxID=3374550 RepID=UPI003757C35C